MLSKKPKTNGDEKEKRREREKKEKGNGSDSDSSGEECGTVRTHRISNTLRPRITGFTPSPRVSTTSQPVGTSNMSHAKREFNTPASSYNRSMNP